MLNLQKCSPNICISFLGYFFCNIEFHKFDSQVDVIIEKRFSNLCSISVSYEEKWIFKSLYLTVTLLPNELQRDMILGTIMLDVNLNLEIANTLIINSKAYYKILKLLKEHLHKGKHSQILKSISFKNITEILFSKFTIPFFFILTKTYEVVQRWRSIVSL